MQVLSHFHATCCHLYHTLHSLKIQTKPLNFLLRKINSLHSHLPLLSSLKIDDRITAMMSTLKVLIHGNNGISLRLRQLIRSSVVSLRLRSQRILPIIILVAADDITIGFHFVITCLSLVLQILRLLMLRHFCYLIFGWFILFRYLYHLLKWKLITV